MFSLSHTSGSTPHERRTRADIPSRQEHQQFAGECLHSEGLLEWCAQRDRCDLMHDDIHPGIVLTLEMGCRPLHGGER